MCFDAQDAAYKASVLASNVTKRVSIEAGALHYWYKYVGFGGRDGRYGPTFGESAPGGESSEALRFTVENVVKLPRKS